jgi:hypothetical protein
MKKFNERAFLVRALVGIFAVQIGFMGYQVVSCRNNLSSPVVASQPASNTNEKHENLCLKLSDNFIEAGKSAANVFLALLVPAATALGFAKKNTQKKDPSTKTDSDNTLGPSG